MSALAQFTTKLANTITFDHTCANGHELHIVAESYLDLVTKLTPYICADACPDRCAGPDDWTITDSRPYHDSSDRRRVHDPAE